MKTMGNLVGDYVKAIYKPGNHTHNPPDENTFWSSFSTKFGFDESYIEERRASMARLVEERNKLIHQLLPVYDQSSINGCMAMIKALDEQHAMLAPEYKRVATIYRQLKEVQKKAFNILFDELERRSE